MTKRFLSFWLLLAIGTATVVFNSCNRDEPKITVIGISLNKTTLTLAIGESETLVATVTPENATDKTVTWESNNLSIATVDVDGKVTAVAVGTITITAKAGDKTAECVVTITNNPLTHDEGVEINGVRWATRNVDMPNTFAENPESFGMFYQWNRKIAWSSSNPLVNSVGGTEWENTLSAGTEWEKANNPCPQGWRVPTRDELAALRDSGSEWITVNEVNGRQFGTVPNTIFLPAAGGRRNTSGALFNVSLGGLYWSSTFSAANAGWNLDFLSSHVSVGSNNTTRVSTNRAYGFSIRCVSE